MGKTRKPTELHRVEGTTNATRHANRQNEPEPTGRPSMPPGLLPREKKVWDQYLEIGYWLTEADSEAFAVWCQMTASEIRRHSEKSPEGKRIWIGGVSTVDSARLAQWRMMGAELGFMLASRSKVNVGNALGKKDKAKESAEARFFRHTG